MNKPRYLATVLKTGGMSELIMPWANITEMIPSQHTHMQDKTTTSLNPLTAEWALRALIDFALSNTRRFYSSMGNPLDGKGLKSVAFRQIVNTF